MRDDEAMYSGGRGLRYMAIVARRTKWMMSIHDGSEDTYTRLVERIHDI